MKWSKEEILFLENNYKNKGLSYCVDNLNRTKNSIKNKVSKLGIRIRPKKMKLFNNINDGKINKEISYILGYLWADGHISKNIYNISLSCIKEDMLEIKHIIMSTDEWNINEYKSKNYRHKVIINYYFGNKETHSLLKSLDFGVKSNVSADKVLSIIPEKYHFYFFRGLSDGDGSFYINKKNYVYQYILSSTYEQDWSFFIRLLNKLNIKYREERIIGKKSKYSQIRIVGAKYVKLYGDYLYQKNKNMGLKRKLDKYIDICNNSKNNMNQVYHSKNELFNFAKNGKSIRDLMKEYNYSSGLYEYVKKYNGLKEMFDKNSNQSKPLSNDKKILIKQMIIDGFTNKEIMQKHNIKKGVLSNLKKEVMIFY